MVREDLVAELANAIGALTLDHPVRAAIDGVGASGKTRLADEIGEALGRSGRPVIRAGVDGFHRPESVRHRLGPLSPMGYYRDSFDYAAIVSCLLEPLGPDGSLRYRTATYDFRIDAPVESPVLSAPRGAVLLFDGVFLLRPELSEHWDFRIFVDASFESTLSRALVRDVDLFGSPEAVRKRYLKRYIPGETLYLREVRPRERVDVVVENDDPADPGLVWRRGERAAPNAKPGG
jgi:uridine kinase